MEPEEERIRYSQRLGTIPKWSSLFDIPPKLPPEIEQYQY